MISIDDNNQLIYHSLYINEPAPRCYLIRSINVFVCCIVAGRYIRLTNTSAIQLTKLKNISEHKYHAKRHVMTVETNRRSSVG